HLLVGAQYEKVPAELQRGLPLEMQRPRLVQQLSDDRGFDDALAEWAVNAWAYALGIVQQPPSRLIVANQPRPPQPMPLRPIRAVAPPASQHEITPNHDFAVVNSSYTTTSRRSGGWFWVVVVGSIMLLAFASGMAIMTLMNRTGGNNAGSPPVALPTHTPLPGAGATAIAVRDTPTVPTTTATTTNTP